MAARTLRIGMLGLGGVGAGVYRAVASRPARWPLVTGGPLTVARALVRDASRARECPPELLTTDPARIVEAADVDLVIEVLGGLSPARELVARALSRGKPVITANKELIAHHGPELLALAAKNNVELRYEASVGGAIPIVGRFERDLAANEVRSLAGIINGTTNYILSRMSAEGIEYAQALAAAQSLGYAEPDPRNDVQGHDAAFKLVVLASLAFGAHVRVEEVYREGIDKLEARDFQYAAELGYAIKLLAIARRAGDKLEARVHPVFIPREWPLARIDGPINAVQLECDLAGQLVFQGRGAGPEPTASAVLGDAITVARRIQDGLRPPSLPAPGAPAKLLPMSEVDGRYYLRIDALDKPGVLAKIALAFGDRGVSIGSVLQRERSRDGERAEVVVMTHRAREGAVLSAIEALRAGGAEGAATVRAMIRVEGDEPSRAFRGRARA